ncbi:MAG: hypothetical protein K6E62_12890 [Lachnospiraceae bacterium]|nr:hypothetical protein [Lachnospiraceae bacterium]
MAQNMIKSYKEVKLDRNGRGEDRFYRNPLTRVFQYEYALYLTVADLFEAVRCRSMCVDSLKLYFLELGHKKEQAGNEADQVVQGEDGNNKITREDLLAEMELLVSKDVVGHIIFPMIGKCIAEVRTVLEEDGTHSFIFTDGIYGFRLHLDIQRKGHPKKIEVTDLGENEQVHDRIEIAHAAHESAA